MAKKKFLIKATCYDKRGRVLSTAENSYTKTHPLQDHFAKLVGMPEKQFLHAEITALLRAKDNRVHLLSIERYDAHGNPAMAAPCKICSLAIKKFGVREVKYTVG